jgi:uridine kinase
MVNIVSTGGDIPIQRQESIKKKPFFIGVSGGTASGKTSVCKTVIEQIKEDPQINDTNVAILYADLFYKDLSPPNLILAKQGKFNFDHPNAIDFELFYKTIQQLQTGADEIQVPKYSYVHNRRVGWDTFKNADVIIIEGILIFYDVRIRNIFEMKIFVDCDADTRLARRVERDISHRGRTIETVLTQYTEFVKPCFEDFCLPTKKYVDIILPRGKENIVAINLISQHVHDLLSGSIDSRQRRLQLAKLGHNETPSKPSSPVEHNILPNTDHHNNQKCIINNSINNDIDLESSSSMTHESSHLEPDSFVSTKAILGSPHEKSTKRDSRMVDEILCQIRNDGEHEKSLEAIIPEKVAKTVRPH